MIEYKLIKLSNNLNNYDNCFICMNKINYYIKFDCECHNYLHINCMKDNYFFTNCLICKKKITKKCFFDFNNFEITNYILNYFDIKYYFEKILNLLINNPNCITLFLHFVINLFFAYIILCPLIFFDFMNGIYKKILIEINDFEDYY